MGDKQFTGNIFGLGPFIEGCRATTIMDWRRYCKDGLFEAIPLFVTDRQWYGRHYETVVIGGDINYEFREPMVLETGGENNGSCYGTEVLQQDPTMCSYPLPAFQTIRLQTGTKDEDQWLEEFCSKYTHINRQQMKSPFIRSGGQLQLRIDNTCQTSVMFGDWLLSRLWAGVAEHIIKTILIGQKQYVDQFDGFYTITDNGIQGTLSDDPQTPCPWPTGPAMIDFGELVTGIPGAVVHPASVIPDNTPPVILFEGTPLEITFPVAGLNALEIQRQWKTEVVTPKWGYEVRNWRLFVGKDGSRCMTDLAGCFTICSDPTDCNPLRAENPQEIANMINGNYVKYWPNNEKVPVVESPSLKKRNEQILMPLEWLDGDMWASLLGVIAVDQANEFDLLQQMTDPLQIQNAGFGLPEDRLEYQQPRPEFTELMDQTMESVFRLYEDRSDGPFCYGLAMSAKMLMFMECWWAILYMKGINCNSSPQQVCPPDVPDYPIGAGCTEIPPSGAPYQTALQLTIDPMANWDTGDTIYYQTAYGTTHIGVVQSYDAVTGSLAIDFENPDLTCDTGGGADGGYVSGNGSKSSGTWNVKTCDGAASPLFNITYDSQYPLGATVGDAVRVTSALSATYQLGTITTVNNIGPGEIDIDVTFVGPPIIPTDCDWDGISLTLGGSVEIVW